jgi:hypothetical protein
MRNLILYSLGAGAMSQIASRFVLVSQALLLTGCGTVVPGLQELSVDPAAEQKLVQAIVTSIHCDISNAVYDFINQDIAVERFNNGQRQAAWLDNWGAQVTITLTVEEKTIVNPTAIGTPPSPATNVFTIGGSVTGSADATRTDKVNYFYTVKELYQRARCATGQQPNTGAPSLLIQDDLKIGSWLFDQIAVGATHEGTYAGSASNVFKQNVLSQDTKFEVVTSGGLTPAWKLVRVSVNPSGTFFNTSRDRTSDLLVTFGPLDPSQNNMALIPQAANVHFVQQLGLAVSTNNNFINFSIFPQGIFPQ